MTAQINRGGRSWTRSKRISFGCLDWRSVDRDSKQTLAKNFSLKEGTSLYTASHNYFNQLEQNKSFSFEVQQPGRLYQCSRSKANSPADALLRRLRLLSSSSKRRPKTDDDLAPTSGESPLMARSSSAPRSMIMSPISKEWNTTTGHGHSDPDLFWQLKGTSQSAISLQSAPERTSNENIQPELPTFPEGSRTAAESVQLGQTFGVLLNKNHSSPEVRPSDEQLHSQNDTVRFIQPDLPLSVRYESGRFPLNESVHTSVRNEFKTNIPKSKPRDLYESQLTSMFPLQSPVSVSDKRTQICSQKAPLFPGNSHARTDEHCNGLHPVEATLPHNWSIKVSQPIVVDECLIGERRQSEMARKDFPYIPTPATDKRQVLDEDLCIINPDAYQTRQTSIHYSEELPLERPFTGSHERTKCTSSNLRFWLHSNINFSQRVPKPELGKQNENYPCEVLPETVGSISFKSQTVQATRPDSLLSTSYTTVNSTNSDLINQSPTTSNDSALGTNILPGQLVSPKYSKEDTIGIESQGFDPVRHKRINPLRPPPFSDGVSIEYEGKRQLDQTSSSMAEFVPPPTPRKSMWYQHAVPSNVAKPYRLSPQVRAERKQSSYVNASSYFASPPNPDKYGPKSCGGSTSPPPAWSQLLPYRVSTVPQNLSERLKKSETLPNDVWIQTRSSEKVSEPREYYDCTSNKLPCSTKELTPMDGSKSPPPRPPVRTTSQRRFRPAHSSIYVNSDLNNFPIPVDPRTQTRLNLTADDHVQAQSQADRLKTSHKIHGDFDGGPVLNRYSQLYSLLTSPKMLTTSNQLSSSINSHPPAQAVVSEIPSLYVERLHLRS